MGKTTLVIPARFECFRDPPKMSSPNALLLKTYWHKLIGVYLGF